jgi:hypothetical protein
MRPIRHLRVVALVALAALANACSDSSTNPSVAQPATLSQVLGELQPSSLAAVSAQISAAPLTGLNAPDPASCSYDSATKSFICPSVSVTGVTVTRSFTLLDASGNPQSQFDPTTTAAVRMKSTFAGTITYNGSTVNVDQQQASTLSGLLTGVHTLNGTSLGHLTGNVGNGTTTTQVASTISTTITDLVLPQSSTGANPWPQSGTIAATAATTLGALPTVTVNTSITFNGTSKVAVTTTTAGQTSHCTVDLSGATPMVCTA